MSRHKFKILSIDGGGIKGIIPCTILNFIEKHTGQRIARLFNVIAGTSTGGVIALGLTSPNENGGVSNSAEDMLNLYLNHGRAIFSRRPKDFLSWIGSMLEKGLFDRNFNVEQFEKLLYNKFGDIRLKDLLTDVLVTTYAPQDEKPFYFSSRLAREDEKENFLIREVALSTSAAPTYFKPSKIEYGEKNTHAFIDGGVFANNPSILAYGEAKELWKKAHKTIRVTIPEYLQANTKTFEAVVEPNDNDLPFFLLSLGCGHSGTTIDFNDAEDWRTKDWIKPLLTNVFMQSVAESTDYAMKYLLPPFEDQTARYARLDVRLPEANSQMDDSSEKNMKALHTIANSYVEENSLKLQSVCNILMD